MVIVGDVTHEWESPNATHLQNFCRHDVLTCRMDRSCLTGTQRAQAEPPSPCDVYETACLPVAAVLINNPTALSVAVAVAPHARFQSPEQGIDLPFVDANGLAATAPIVVPAGGLGLPLGVLRRVLRIRVGLVDN